jgi:hypothetical protein
MSRGGGRATPSVVWRTAIALAVDSGDLTRIVCGALRAVALRKHSGGMLGLGYSIVIGGMSRLSAS